MRKPTRITEVITQKKCVDLKKLFWFELYEMCEDQCFYNGTLFFVLLLMFFLPRQGNLCCLK